jgi:hypothetical protein
MPKQALEELTRKLQAIEEHWPDGSDDPIQRRIAIRSSFAAVESLAAAMMATALPAISQMAVTSTASDEDRNTMFFQVCALSDLSYQITNFGEIKIQQARTGLKNKTLFAINMLAKSNGVQITPKEIQGWTDFKKAIDLRNRITHPKNADDLAVSQEEYDSAIKGLQWIVRCKHRACGGNHY